MHLIHISRMEGVTIRVHCQAIVDENLPSMGQNIQNFDIMLPRTIEQYLPLSSHCSLQLVFLV